MLSENGQSKTAYGENDANVVESLHLKDNYGLMISRRYYLRSEVNHTT